MTARRTVVVTGACGGLGRVVIRQLLLRPELDVLAIDKRNWVLDSPERFRFRRVDLRRGAAEDLLRTERPWGLVHLAFVSNQRVPLEQRHEVNVVATQRLLELAAKYGVEHLVVLSRATVYGARPENPSLITEDMPLKLGAGYSELHDLVEFDQLCRSWMWEHRDRSLAILRPVHVVGPNIREGMLHRLLQRRKVPVPMGFDPMVQLVHEDDVAFAVERALERGARGIFNLPGPGQLPLSRLIRESGRQPTPVPHALLEAALGVAFRLGGSDFPPTAVDFLRFACLVDGAKAAAELGYVPRRSLIETVAAIPRGQGTVVA